MYDIALLNHWKLNSFILEALITSFESEAFKIN